VLTQIRLTPDLARCTRESLLGAIMQCAQVGLEPGPLGQVYFVPYRRQGVLEVVMIIGYRGLLDLVRRSGQVLQVASHIVYEHDDFEVVWGTDERIVHRPRFADRGRPVLAYAVARLRDGGTDAEVMTVEEIEAIRRRSRAADTGPWVTDWGEMARKTVLRRLCKRLPMAIEAQWAVAADETVRTDFAPGGAGPWLDLPLAPSAGDADAAASTAGPEALDGVRSEGGEPDAPAAE
jgi:recombination protein RecT